MVKIVQQMIVNAGIAILISSEVYIYLLITILLSIVYRKWSQGASWHGSCTILWQ